MITLKEGKIITVTVCSAGWTREVAVDTSIFDDVCVEACTQIIEQGVKEKIFEVSPIMEAHIKHGNSETVVIYNTYKILINAAKYKKAEILRKNFLKEFGIDLKNEPIRSGM